MRIEGTLTSAGGPIGPGGTLNVDVTSLDTSVPSTAGAVVLDVTAVNPSASGFLSVYPTGSITDPATADANGTLTSNLNFAAHETVANLVEVPLSSGSVTIYNHSGTTGVDVDVFGYYSPLPSTGATSGLYNSISPTRVLGTLQAGQSVGQDSTTAVTVAGVDGVPSDATAVVVNLTASDATAGGYVSAYAAGSTKPVVSNLNYAAGQIVANRAVVPVGSNGQIDLYNSFGPGVTSGSVNLDVDLDGYYTGSASESGGAFVAVSPPKRVIDTRSSMNGSPIAANSTEKFTIPSSDVPTTATAVAANVTVVPETMNPGFLTIYPTSDSSVPVASDINWADGMIVPNFTYLPTDGTGSFNAFNNPGGAVNLIADVFGYFTPVVVPTGVTVTATPSTVNEGGTSTITALVRENSTDVTGDQVSFTVSPTTCGTISPTTGIATTNASGVATVTYTASDTTGTCTVTATDADYGMTGTAVITQTAPANTVALVVNPAKDAANGAAASSVTATVTNPSGAPVSGDTVTFTESPSLAGSCGTLSPTTGTTTSLGTVTVAYVSSSVAGFCNITATESDTGGSATTPIDQYSTTTANTVKLSPTSPTLDATGTAMQVFTATVTNSSGAAVANDSVMFTASSPSPSGACGTFATPFATTNSSGVATDTYTSSTTAGTCSVTATDADSDTSSSASTVTQSAVVSVSVSASPTSIPANSTSTSVISADVTLPSGAPASGDVVTFSATGTGTGTFSSTTATTNASGIATTDYVSSTTPGFVVITAAAAPSALVAGNSGTTIVDQTSPTVTNTPYSVSVTPSPASIPANSTSTSTLTVTVKDSTGAVVSGDPLSFSLPSPAPATCGTLSATSGVTNASGQATVVYTSSSTTGSCVITVNEAQDGQSATATITETTPSDTVTVTPSPAAVAANGATASSVTATVTNPSGAAVSGDTVTFTTAAYPAGACGTVSPTSGTTNASGAVTVAYVSSTTSGFCTITAKESATNGSGTGVIDQIASPAPSTTYSVAVNSPTLNATGTTTTTLTATVDTTSTSGVGVPNDPVMFTLTGTPAAACGTLSSAMATTNASGVASVTYTTSTTAGNCTITATEANDDQSGSGTVAQKAVDVVTVNANPASIVANGTSISTITATVTTSSGAPISGATVDWTVSSGGGTFSTNSSTTNSAGQAVVDYISSTTPGFYTIKATVTTSHGGTGTVTIDQTS
jgi:hypothetical protein